MNAIFVTILPIDREKGDEARKQTRGMQRAKTCTLAQALRRELGIPTVTCGMFDVSIGDNVYVLPNEATRFIHAEDDADNTEGRYSLPFTFTMTREPSEE